MSNTVHTQSPRDFSCAVAQDNAAIAGYHDVLNRCLLPSVYNREPVSFLLVPAMGSISKSGNLRVGNHAEVKQYCIAFDEP